jgi:hypothetical protein
MPPRGQTLLVAALIASLLVPHPALAWGREGHRIVARIAAKNLSQTARDKLRRILGVTTDAALATAMASAAIWPDRIDKAATGTARWHFINIPLGEPFSIDGHCANHDCIVDQIENMRNRLQKNQTGFSLLSPPSPARGMTSQELAFLIHFVGDLHQPLHAITNGDRGGGCVPLSKPLVHHDGSSDTTDLHLAWDIDTVLAAMKGHGGSEQATATALFTRFKNGDTVTQGTPADWARESNTLAKSAIYDTLSIAHHASIGSDCVAGIKPVLVTQTYLTNNVALVERRLMEAGIRLSNVLNEICSGMGCRAKP